MLNVVLYQPLIPQNTGTIARLTAATNTYLHIIEPMGFEISDKYLKRAGLDYWPWVKLTVHKSWDNFLEVANPPRLNLYTKHATQLYWDAKYQREDFLVFGNEEQGLPQELHERYNSDRYLIPMENPNVRSINVACSVGIVLYEAIRQVSASS
jgi:tRNA (cytidine/uridine-2'-O-)-methyltransferase